ncbi:VWFA domain-containing protein OS=Streptomyces glaucescens OX=1907 GN=SGLAU_20660 PE=4 SV=1 [Streptomyces glaucescens]
MPERLIGYGRASRSVKKDVVLCVDQTGSMAASVVHASVFGAVLASMRSVSTRFVVFDTAVVDPPTGDRPVGVGTQRRRHGHPGHSRRQSRTTRRTSTGRCCSVPKGGYGTRC